jgi:hypothetical protein
MDKNREDQILGENESVRVIRTTELRNYQEKEVSQYKVMPDPRGAFMMDLVRTWGMVGAQRGTDTQAGRPTLELLTVEQVVDRAAAMTHLTFKTIERQGWQVALDRTPPAEAEDHH